MFSVGLTGGIASGKTTISNLFSTKGVPVIDTDIISRSLLQPGESAFEQVREHFGEEILDSNGNIDRVRLREIVFTQTLEKRWLEAMLHPLIYQRSHDAIVENAGEDYVLVVVPLLFETNFQSLVDRVLAVDCPAEIQIERLVRRDKIDESLAQKMLDQQLSNDERLARAHDSIKNDRGKDQLNQQVAKLHAGYLELARNQ